MDAKAEREEAAGGLIHNWERPRDPDLPFPYLDWDSYSGIARKYVKGNERGKWHIHSRSVDLQANIDDNRRRQNEGRNTFKVDGLTFHHVASIPVYVAELWKKIYGIDVFNKDHEKAVDRLLNDPDLRYLKTTHKTI